jgi:hypothetical protein
MKERFSEWLPLTAGGMFAVSQCLMPSPVRSEGIPEPPVVLYGQVRDNTGGLNARLTSGELVWTFAPASGGPNVVLTTQLSNVIDQFSFVIFVPCETELPGLMVSTNALKLASPAVTYVRTNVTWNGLPLILKNPAQGSLTVNAASRGQVERLDVGLGQFPPDSDGDGLPDWWESLYPQAGNPDGDADGDGLTNRKEFVAGTNPQDAGSSLEFVEVIAEEPGVALIVWSSVAGRSYTLLRAPTLSTDPRDYLEVRSGIIAQGSVTSYRDRSATGTTGFYRVRVAE